MPGTLRVAETEFEANPNRVASGPVYKPLFGFFHEIVEKAFPVWVPTSACQWGLVQAPAKQRISAMENLLWRVVMTLLRGRVVRQGSVTHNSRRVL